MTALRSAQTDAAALAEAPAKASRAEWDRLVAQHDRAVRVALLARGIRADRSRDLAQSAWATLWERFCAGRIERLELPGLAIQQAWFLSLAESRRASASGAQELSPQLSSTLADPAPGADGRIFARQQLDRVRRELESCPASAREVFFLVHGTSALSHADAAEKTGLSVQRVRQILCELRARLRPVLEESP